MGRIKGPQKNICTWEYFFLQMKKDRTTTKQYLQLSIFYLLMKRTTGPQNKIFLLSIFYLQMERTRGPQNKICTWAYFISKWRRPQDHKTRYALEHISSLNEEDHRTTKQDLHFSLLYLQMERTTGSQNKICTWAYFISKWKGPKDHKTIIALEHVLSLNGEDNSTKQKIFAL
jgi:hypothetical protein